MKPYIVSLAIGILVGAVYALLRVRSPAPPVIALLGLLGMLVGEQGVGIVLAHLQPPVASEPSSAPPGNSHAP